MTNERGTWVSPISSGMDYETGEPSFFCTVASSRSQRKTNSIRVSMALSSIKDLNPEQRRAFVLQQVLLAEARLLATANGAA